MMQTPPLLRVSFSARRLALLAAAALSLGLLSACDREITDANLKLIKPDMTTKEVESILGAPNRVVTVSEPSAEAVKTLPIVRYVYEQKGQKIELTFVGDRLGEGPKGAPAITGTLGK
ncbi:MAG: hypothetical protein PHQ12_12310 [Chthoniobacteraceae bacterium]|nr:hypothetical protein [Chthoniobacteraceae bacterium]